MEKLSSESFDAVLMDVQMPELDGVETVKAIRAASGRFGNLPVIAMTAHAMLGDRERFLDAGMSDYIAKPIEEKELIAVLKKWIGGTEPITAKQKLPVPPPADKTEMLPGLLIGDGVRRTNGNMQLYKRLLAEFRREMDEVLPHLRSLIEGNVTSEAMDVLHTVKGSSATLGARRVAEIAAALESRLRKGEAITADELAEAVAEVRMSIDAFLSADAPPVVETKPGASNPQILPIAKRLAEHLRKNNLAAMSCFEELKAVAGSRFGEPMVKLEQSLDRLDFDAARVHLESIETQLEEAAQ
jgi:CheY-like chemotaxis protein/HPt (histidine-containing phosphotransfer) domain-containing protein